MSIFFLGICSIASPPPFYKVGSLIKSPAIIHKCAQLSHSHHIMDYRFVLLLFAVGSCAHNTGDSLLYCCLILIVSVIPIVVLVPGVADGRKNEQAPETSEVLFPCCSVDSLSGSV